MRKLDIGEIHKILLEITSVVVDILNKENINYYAIGGTMLGAIRHKGFIPWDDDIDIGIMRKDFEKTIAVLKEKLPVPYKVRTIYDCYSITNDPIKIEDTRTSIIEKGKGEGKTYIGVNIDLFPLDKSHNNNFSITSKNRLIHIVYRLNKSRLLPDTRLSRVLSPFLKILLAYAKRDFLIKVMHRLISMDGHYIVNYYGGVQKGNGLLCEDIFGKGKQYKFEDLLIYGVDKPEEYLSAIYDDYMKLPPKDHRQIHIVNAYWK